MIRSRARASSKPGQMNAGSPRAGSTSTNGRSESPHCTPVKYVMLVPGSSTTAPTPFSRISSRARSIRARRSSSVMGDDAIGHRFE